MLGLLHSQRAAGHQRDNPRAGAHSQKARQLLERALELQPENLQAIAYLGNVLAQQGEFDEARQLCVRGLRVDPEDRQLQGLLARLGGSDREISLLSRRKRQHCVRLSKQGRCNVKWGALR